MIHFVANLTTFKMAAHDGQGTSLPMYIVDAFSNRIFGGNPAAVCLLGHMVSMEHGSFLKCSGTTLGPCSICACTFANALKVV